MPERLPAKTTPVTAQEMFTALGCAWKPVMGGRPRKEPLLVLVSQSAFETGWWKYMWCYNVGNVKSVEGDGRDYTYFRCWELLPVKSVPALQAHPHFGHLVSVESVNDKGIAKVWFSPDHPGCRFRAYKNLNVAAVDHLTKLMSRFSDENPEKNAWGFAMKADPAGFSRALKKKGYYTGDEAIYTKRVKEIYDLLLKKGWDESQIPDPTPEEEDEVRNWRIIATSVGVREALENRKDDDDNA